MGTLWQDIRYSIRMLRKRLGGSLVVIATLSLVIGAMTLAAGVLEHERSAWMPFPDGDRLVRLWRIGLDRPQAELPAGVYAGLCGRLTSLEDMAAIGGSRSYAATGREQPFTLSGLQVSPRIFELAGMSPVLGRGFSDRGPRPADDRVVVLSHGVWQERFGGSPSVAGETVQLDDELYRVVGVMAEGADRNALFYGIDIWLPADFESPAHAEERVNVVGRLKQGASFSDLDAELDVAAPPVVQQFTSAHGWTPWKTRISAFRADKQFGTVEAGPVVAATVIPLFVLLIACFNVANILLGQMAARRGEMALRFSLGAGRSRLVRQLLTESIVLSVIAGGLGSLCAYWVSQWSAARGIEAEFSVVVLGGVLAVSLFVGIAVGWMPAWSAIRRNLNADLKEGGTAFGGASRHRLSGFLVVSQVAMATVLCISAGLLLRSYWNRTQFDPGFNARNLLVVGVSLTDQAYGDPARRMLYCDQTLDRLSDLPGVAAVGVASTHAVDRYPFPMGVVLDDGEGRGRKGRTVQLTVADPEYLKMTALRPLLGRSLTDRDRQGSDPVVLVNQSFLSTFLPGVDPLGRRIGLNVETGLTWFTVVGVVPDRRNLGFHEHLGPEAFVSHRQVAPTWAPYCFLIRTKGTPILFAMSVREVVQSVDPDQPVGRAFLLSERIATSVRRNVEGVLALGVVGLFGLLMAVLGVYGVVARSVAERTHEVGVRMSLGAGSGHVLRLILRRAMGRVMLGVAAGCVLAACVTFGLSELLFGIHPMDLPTYLGVTSILTAAALGAILIPARRAARIDPMAALRCE